MFRRGAGAGKSFITGSADPSSGNGYGTGAVRCVEISNSVAETNKVAVQGFTLRDAWYPNASRASDVGYSTTAAFYGVAGTHLIDCDVTGCHGGGAVVFFFKTPGIVERCRFTGNATENYVVAGNRNNGSYINLTSSVVADNARGVVEFVSGDEYFLR